MRKRVAVFMLLALLCLFLNADFDFSKIKGKVSQFTLDNGLTFILLEDHSVPIASFITLVNVGGCDERIGIWGISHFLEHLAFKGTPEIGTKNYKAEKKVLNRMDEVFEKILAEKSNLQPDEQKIKKYREELDKLQKEAARFVNENEFDIIFKRHGAVGLNAGTSKDVTLYLISLPSNKIELWAYLESSRFTDPVFREFFKERQVIQEERRAVIENNPLGKLIEELLALAYKEHPYRIIGIGPMSNIEHISRRDVIAYFRSNYTAKNMVIGAAGDIYPGQLKKLAKKYFSRIRPGKKNPRLFTLESKQRGEKTVTIYEDSQPALLVGYHCPSVVHEDFVKFRILDYILTTGRSSRLNKKLVVQDKSALVVGSFAGAPGNKYPSLYLVFALPNMGHSTEEILQAIDEEISNIRKEPIGEEELRSAKTRIKVASLRQMKSMTGLMMSLVNAQVMQGGWEKAFADLDRIEKVSAKEIQDLVNTYLTSDNRSIARLEKNEEVKK